MKTLTTLIAITLTAFTARASEPVPYIAMPIDNGYAIDAHGKRQPNASCARDLGASSNSGARTLIKAMVADGV